MPESLAKSAESLGTFFDAINCFCCIREYRFNIWYGRILSSLSVSILYDITAPLQSLPIHPSAFSLPCISLLRYELLFNISDRPSTIFHATCSACVRASRNCKPCLPSQFLIIHTLCLHSLIFYVLSISFTSNLKYLSTVYHMWHSSQRYVVSVWVCPTLIPCLLTCSWALCLPQLWPLLLSAPLPLQLV